MKNEKFSSEQGHADMALAALGAAICIILLVIGVNRESNVLFWIGGIGAAVGILAQFWFTHQAITSTQGRLDELEKKQ